MIHSQNLSKIILVFASLLASPALTQAGVFNIPQFVEYEGWAVGLEPEATLSAQPHMNDNGLAINAKFTYGITPLSNLQIGLGTGSGSRGFRLGGTYTFDFIPDLDGQIGAGLALQAYHYKLRRSLSQTEFTLYPYFHNAYPSPDFILDPYLAIPWGLAFYNGTYNSIIQLVLGTHVKTSEHFGMNSEIGINLKATDTYISFGVTYRD